MERRIEILRETVSTLATASLHVKLNPDAIFALADEIKDDCLNSLVSGPFLPVHKSISGLGDDFDTFSTLAQRNAKVVRYELMASAVNYCYWYGSCCVRPGGSSARKMYKLLDETFDEKEASDELIETFIRKLSDNAFPLMEDRARHLRELNTDSVLIYLLGQNETKENTSLLSWMSYLLKTYPGFAGDVFLKRACLFFFMLNARTGWFNDEIGQLRIPAEYQIPKVLRQRGCLEYQSELAEKVDSFQLIPKGSLMECEIRACSIMACADIAERIGCREVDVDRVLFSRKNEIDTPFHLCVTTDY